MQKRRRTKHTITFRDRLAAEAIRLKEQARKLPPSSECEEFLRKARQTETAAKIDEWLSSPGLQPPRQHRF